MRVKITESIDDHYAAGMAKGLGMKTGADYKSFIAQSRQQSSMKSWFAIMDFLAGKWVEVEMKHLFDSAFNIGDPPGFVAPVDRHPLVSGARVEMRYVEAVDFSPQFRGPKDYLEAVQLRYDVAWPGTKVSQELMNRLACGAMRDETPQCQMDRDEFMAFFRTDDKLNTLSTADRVEVFLQVLLGQSDITKSLLEQLCSDYGTTLEWILAGSPEEEETCPAS